MREEMTLEQARRTLGLSARAKGVDVRRAFKRLALEHHPDRNRNPEDTRAAERFRKICLAHEILIGNREPAPDTVPVDAVPSGATASYRTWTVRAPWDAPEAPRPEVSLDGRPLHYPTPEEIAALDVPPTVSSQRIAQYGLGGVVLFVAVIWLVMFVSHPDERGRTNNTAWTRHGFFHLF